MIEITDECKAAVRARLRTHLLDTRFRDTPFRDAADILDDWLAEIASKAEERGFEHGFREGESKQAILELRGRDRFLAGVRAQMKVP